MPEVTSSGEAHGTSRSDGGAGTVPVSAPAAAGTPAPEAATPAPVPPPQAAGIPAPGAADAPDVADAAQDVAHAVADDPDAAEAAQDVAHAVYDSLNALARWSSRGSVRRATTRTAATELSPTDIWLLGAIERDGPVRVSNLARWQGVDKSTVTPQVRRLEDRGLVQRQGDPVDRRAALLTITESGREVRRQIVDAAGALIRPVLASWPARDRAVLADLLSRFADELLVGRVPQGTTAGGVSAGAGTGSTIGT